MEAGLDTILQGGGLALFVWFVIQNNREWRLYLTERNGKLEKALEKQSNTLEKLGDTLDKHNEMTTRLHEAAARSADSAAASATSAAASASKAAGPSVIINK